MPKENKIIKICPICGTTFITIPSNNQKYCSRECANKSRKTGEDVVCDYCGKTFYRNRYHINRQAKKQQHQFCSLECQINFKYDQTHEIRKCEVCKKNFEVYKNSTQRFCSDKCQHIWQITIVGELNPNFKSVKILCDYCGKEYYVRNYKLNEQEHFFCSVQCRQNWYAEVYSQTDEFKELHRQKILNQFSNGNLQSIDSKPQIIINNILDKNHIQYKREENCTYYSIDNYLVDSGLMIEVQGDYWHSNPTIFSDKLSQIQYDRINKDKRKHSYIKNQYGIEILYLWEHDIIYNQEICEQLIKEYIAKNGILPNYHSFNYHLCNKAVILNDIFITPYQDMHIDQYKKLLIS